MNKLHLDFETRSPLDLTEVGAWKYAMHPQTEIMCMGWGHHQNAIQVARDWKVPGNLLGHADQIVAHNAGFEYAIYECILHRRYGWPSLKDPKYWNCTMARAAMCGLPLKLENLANALQLKTPKDLEGRRVMQQLCKPIMIDALGDPVYDEDPVKYQRLYLYNQNDVRSEMEADSLLPELPEFERAIFELDLIINTRGVSVDVELAQRAADLASYLTNNLNDRLKKLTDGTVESATRVQRMKDWLAANGVLVDSLDKVAVTDLLKREDVPVRVKEVVSIRRQVGKSSTAKFEKTVATAAEDGRVRGVLQYHAAHTGRWGGRLIQPQNYPKGVDEKTQNKIIEQIALTKNSLHTFEAANGANGMENLSSILRGTIVAGPGKILCCADYNAIEARVLFWEANAREPLAAYRRGESPYLAMAEYLYNKKVDKHKDPKEYDIGKRLVLGAGYGMGAKKFRSTVIAQAGWDPGEELSVRGIEAYRKKYPDVKAYWYEMERAAIQAVKNPTVVAAIGALGIKWGMSKDRRFLICRLPSGRFLWYYKPEIRVMPSPHNEDGKETLCYWGEDPKTHQWVLLKTYGGALVENVTQAIARDLLALGMLRLEANGFPVVLTVHDEIVAEINSPGKNAPVGAQVARMIELMCQLPDWAVGLPLAAEGWEGVRYRK
ncbi:MAG: hypothetical protein KGJ13_02320 [Patescibacteria group bacterium]|nr:hypothetical protein [Patescibacteria group bacterium]